VASREELTPGLEEAVRDAAREADAVMAGLVPDPENYTELRAAVIKRCLRERLDCGIDP
jgi:hypothetical protein